MKMLVKDLKSIYCGKVELYDFDDNDDEYVIWKGELKDIPLEFISMKIDYIYPYKNCIFVRILSEQAAG